MVPQSQDAFAAILQRLKNDRQGLLNLLKKAKQDQAWDRADSIEKILDDHHRDWDKDNQMVVERDTNKEPIEVTFRGAVEVFAHANQAYISIMEKFVALKEIDLDSTLHNGSINPGHARKNIARSLDELFIKSPHLRDKGTNWHQLRNGWYLNLNLTNDDKHTALVRYAVAIGLPLSEWDWKKEGEMRQSLDELLSDLFDD